MRHSINVLVIVALLAASLAVEPARAGGAPLVFGSPIQGQGGGGGATVITYTYDSLYRLTSASYSTGQTFAYAYDPVGNRRALTETVGLTQTIHSYSYDAADRLTSVDGVAYTWDDDGNLLGDGARTYSYDAADRLIAVGGQPSAVSYAYNGDGLLAAQTVGGQATTFTWDVAAGLPQVLATSGGATYLYGLGLLAQQQGGAWQYPLADGLGSIRQMVNPLGQVTQSYRFDPFGLPLGTSGGGPYGYAGEQWDAATGLIYLRARWYDPRLGRFLTRDPFPGLAAAPTTQHPYVYVGNNPVNLTDPGGRIAPILIAAGVGAAIGGVAGGAGYVLTHPGGRPEDYLQSGGFWQAVGIGAAGGAVAGAVGWAVPALLPAGGGLAYAVGAGVLSGAAASAAGQVTANLLTPCTAWNAGLGPTLLVGAVTGGLAGAAGYGLRSWLAPPARGGLTAQGVTTPAARGTTRAFAPGKWLSHFEKHGAEFGYKTSVEYLRGAQRLTAGGEGIQTIVRANGDTLFYNPATNEFAVLSEENIIRTYFKPIEGLQYWLRQTGGR